jgi:hypothetical protein
VQLCGGLCANTNTDSNNCGACGKVCAPGQFCVKGTCTTTCAAGLKRCGSACVDTATDANQCGACDVRCPAGKACVAGVCQA